jgi:cytidylate kinase
MKIYFTGCHGSGKTTCARYVSEKYNLPFITEVARMVLSEKELQIDSLRYDIKTVNEYQLAVFNRQLIEEQNHISFVSDRSGIDSLAYSAQHTNILPQLIKSSELARYLDILRQPDSILFFVRPCKATLRADGVRENITFEGAVAIDAQIKLLYEMWELRYFQIHTDNMQERVRLIDGVLSLHKG